MTANNSYTDDTTRTCDNQGEEVTSSADYTDTSAYDLDNLVQQVHAGSVGAETTSNAYNNDGQLTARGAEKVSGTFNGSAALPHPHPL